jgi:beta-alanine--pyruvate transaminase
MATPVDEPALDLDAYWMPFTANRSFKAAPRLIASAAGHAYRTSDGRRILDSLSGLWTTGLGHGRREIADAVHRQLLTLDYAPAFQVGHEGAFVLAAEIAALAPPGLDSVFFTNSGSEAVDTALKIALAYQQARGKPGKTRLIGRARGYHGANLGGVGVGGMPNNRRAFEGALPSNISHLPSTLDLARNTFVRGQPIYGAEFANALSDEIARHGADSIAAVIVEPVSGSSGVLPPPLGYLERLRALCDAHDILLIFDEVITGFGRLGAPFAAQRFGVAPDLICFAKGVTNGAVPLGGVIARRGVHDALMQGPAHAVEFFHGYTYSGHPVAVAAARATLALLRQENSFDAARRLEDAFAERLHAVRGARHVIDIRSMGLMGGIELASRPDAPGARGLEVHARCFARGALVRNGGDVLQFAPFFDHTPDEIDRIFSIVESVLAETA